jgi:hypothetical protein
VNARSKYAWRRDKSNVQFPVIEYLGGIGTHVHQCLVNNNLECSMGQATDLAENGLWGASDVTIAGSRSTSNDRMICPALLHLSEMFELVRINDSLKCFIAQEMGFARNGSCRIEEATIVGRMETQTTKRAWFSTSWQCHQT